jgi:hypothetical protein
MYSLDKDKQNTFNNTMILDIIKIEELKATLPL